jgi:hypothetical protein
MRAYPVGILVMYLSARHSGRNAGGRNSSGMCTIWPRASGRSEHTSHGHRRSGSDSGGSFDDGALAVHVLREYL